MIHLIVTANDTLYEQLVQEIDCEDDTVQRATSVLHVAKLVAAQVVDRIVVDMAIYAADTLVETLRTRPETAHIPVYIIKTSKQVPLALRRLCTDVLEAPTR
jgi:hypothetical protein